MEVTQLYIYPIKSLGGIALQSTKVFMRGLQYDRRYMLVDEQGVFLTQRTLHKMALFKLNLNPNGFTIIYKNDTLTIPFFITGNTKKVTVWDDSVDAIVANDDFNNWFSKHLEMSVKLVFMPETGQRAVNTKYAKNNEQFSFADGYPVLMISEASLDFLNSKLKTKIGYDRFRPNIVVTANAPHAEDEFEPFGIATAKFKIAKPCGRCVVTTINQNTLQTSKEPLATLAKYRRVDDVVNFGINLICTNPGEIKIGDKLIFKIG
ncbi:MAG: MOSC domain-containing protein [Bacteroidia bacterium]|nr:MOSC domain-containing protein [Bacteroidia bacterium]MBP9689029.1 MOSC domain-containing protein [Bacteroidia bacterium]